jgi:hypothetical protein
MPQPPATTIPPKKAAAGMKKPHTVVPKVKPANMSDADWAKELADTLQTYL